MNELWGEFRSKFWAWFFAFVVLIFAFSMFFGWVL